MSTRTRVKAVRRQNQIIAFGIVAAVLSQYAWLMPVPQAYTVLAVVAMVCAFVVIAWKVAEWLV